MPALKLRPGALVATAVERKLEARFPWILGADGEPAVIPLEPGDAYVHDGRPNLLQVRKPSGAVRTMTEKFDVRLEPDRDEYEMTFRTDLIVVRGPEIYIFEGDLGFSDEGYAVSKEKMFERFCAVLRSPKWNPFDVMPRVSENSQYRVNFESGTISDVRGSGGLDRGDRKEFPVDLLVNLAAPLMAAERLGEESPLVQAGVYQVRPEIVGDDGRVTHLRFDGRCEDTFMHDKMFVRREDYEAACARGHIFELSRRDWKPFSISEYEV